MRPLALALLLFCAGTAIAQDSQTTSCDFDDNMEVSIQYKTGREEPKNGKVWMPGGAPLTLFTQIPLVVNNVTVPTGAYTVYVVPNRKDWTLIVSKNVTVGAKYDPAQDLARAPMELGEIGQPATEVQVALAHVSAKTCSLRIYYGKVGAFVEFGEK